MLLEQHEQLAYEQIAANLDEPPHTVREGLSRLRGIEFVDVLAVGELEAHITRPTAYWRLTKHGREKLAHMRAADRLQDT